MRRGVLVTWLVALLLVPTAVFGPSLVRAQQDERRLEEVERTIANLRNQIESAQSERTEYAEAILATDTALQETKATLFEAEQALTVADGAVVIAEDNLASVTRRIRLLDAELAATRLDQRQTKDEIRERAVELYMNGSVGVQTILFGSESLENTSIRLEYSRNLLQRTEVLLLALDILERQEVTRRNRLSEEQDRQADVLRGLEDEYARAQGYRDALAVAEEELATELAALEALLDEVTSQIDAHEGHVARLEQESKEIELEILRRQVREGRAPGKLAWPVGGRITSPFGWRIHPILGGRRLHTGIDLGSASGVPIHAAANGTVILAETWGGYGRTVVVDHGGGLSTLYAHQSSIAVSRGQEVLAGDVVGYIGCTGFCTGPHLHFEVREVGAPVDPMLYLPG
ncbi:MAG: peptidoglycan DD-metalloendopeptidase family protein [bacterium]|nr:peptidoglycan DD-metalloendopeptidase family protein [bacterium]